MFAKIAVCDDDSIFLEKLEKQISLLFQREESSWGLEYQIDSFQDGAKLLSNWDNEVYDILSLDL